MQGEAPATKMQVGKGHWDCLVRSTTVCAPLKVPAQLAKVGPHLRDSNGRSAEGMAA